MKIIALLASTILLSCSILSAAKAAPPSDPATAVVKFGDLDATRPAGKEALYRRLTRAARVVCRSLEPSDSVTKTLLIAPYKACLEHAVFGAVAQIARPEFTDYVSARMPSSAKADIQLAAR